VNAPSRGLPSLGRRGEGWVVGQVVVFALVVAAGLLGPAWPAGTGLLRTMGALATGLPGLALGVGAGIGLGRQLTPLPAPVEGGALRDRGVYGLCRHPMYGGVVLLCLAWAFGSSPLVFAPAAIAALFLDVKRRLEERWLSERHPDYADYRRRVPWRLVPYVW
jgi:protein-S-isoprenylcysteine O-methyltransferase Ste14